MKIKKQIRKVLFSTIILIIFGLMASNSCFSKEIKKVAILPFVMNTQQDLTFLQKGIFDMFSSRISYGDEVEVLTREDLEKTLADAGSSISIVNNINESKANKLGKLLNVDFVVFGSLTLFENSMSLDVKMVDSKSESPTLTFFRQGNDAGTVIPELDKIAEEINFKVFGRETLAFQSQQALQKAYYEGQGVQNVSPLKKFKALFSANGTLNGVAVGDLDGDNKNEVVVIQDRTIKIFKYAQNGQIAPVHDIQDDSKIMNLIGVGVADINQNGYEEIYITRINNANQTVASYIIEYNGSQYVKGKNTYPWYFNVIKDADGNSQLFAQVHSKKGPWVPEDVFEVAWQNNDYIPGKRLIVPENDFSVLSLISSKQLFNKESKMYLYTNYIGRLVALSDAGQVEWSSDKGYGGSKLFYKIPMSHSDTMYSDEYIYFQPKNTLYDTDDDGKPELFVIKNNEASNYLLKRNRTFKKGSIEIFQWTDIGLSAEGTPKILPGLITSINIGDYDNDSKMELLVTMIKKSDKILSLNSKSMLIVYDL